MTTEVRTEDRELVGWIDRDFSARRRIELSGIGMSDGGEPAVQTMTLECHPVRSEVWRVTPDQLSKLRRSSIFRPLITREMMVSAARTGASWALQTSGRTADLGSLLSDLDEFAERVVTEVFANLIETL